MWRRHVKQVQLEGTDEPNALFAKVAGRYPQAS